VFPWLVRLRRARKGQRSGERGSMEWNGDGTFKRIYSQMTHPVRFPDRQGIAKAQAIAEERAKAAIIRFLDQTVATATFVSEVDNDIEQATRTQGSDDKEAITKTNKRVMIETLGQVAGSAAAGRLKGVIILERGYDEKREEAWVKVGISSKTIGAAEDLGKALSGKGKPINDQKEKSEGQSSKGGDMGLPHQGSEVEKSQQKDW
jgi:hypothetical protein